MFHIPCGCRARIRPTQDGEELRMEWCDTHASADAALAENTSLRVVAESLRAERDKLREEVKRLREMLESYVNPSGDTSSGMPAVE